MRTAYDFGSRFGMDFASDNSYSAIVDINICSMFCATPDRILISQWKANHWIQETDKFLYKKLI